MAEQLFPKAEDIAKAVKALDVEIGARQSYLVLLDALGLYKNAAASYEALQAATVGLAEEQRTAQAALDALRLQVVQERDAATHAQAHMMTGYQLAIHEAREQYDAATEQLGALQGQVEAVQAGLAQVTKDAEVAVEKAVLAKRQVLEVEIHRLEQGKARLLADNIGLRLQQEELRQGVAAMQRRYEAAQLQFAVVEAVEEMPAPVAARAEQPASVIEVPVVVSGRGRGRRGGHA